MIGSMRFSARVAKVVSAASLSLLSLPLLAQAPWKIVELKGPEGAFHVTATSVDRLRNVYGMSQFGNGGGIRPTRWMAATGYLPELVGADQGRLFGSNAKGSFVGWQEMTEPAGGPLSKGVLYAADGTSRYLDGFADYRRLEPAGVNLTNMVAGSIITQDFAWRAFRWTATEATVIPALTDFPYAFGTGISDGGFVVGYGMDNYNPVSRIAAWIWSPTGGVQRLPPVGGYYKALGINNTGLICGSARQSSLSVGVLWPIFGQPEILAPAPGFQNSEAVAVNDRADIAGNIWTGKYTQRQIARAATWFGGEWHDIQAEAGVPNVSLTNARAINNKGDVCGEGNFSGRASGFIAIRRNS
jgi:hypothetical protein